jgi:adenylate cyclase
MTHRAKRISIVSAICIGAAFAVLAMYAKPVFAILKLELLSQDLRAQLGRKTLLNTNLVFLGLEQPGYPDMFGDDEIQTSPTLGLLATNHSLWSRKAWAEVIERLTSAGAKVVALDFVFDTPRQGDEDLQRTLQRRGDRVVLAANFTYEERDTSTAAALATPTPSLLNVPPTMARQDLRVGFVNVWEDRDGVVRSARFQLPPEDTAPGETIRSFAARIVEKFSPSTLLPKDAVPRAIRFTAPPRTGYPFFPLYTIFLPEHWKANYANGVFFKDKVVVVGPAANIFQDEHLVPLARTTIAQGEKVSDRSMPGPEIHLNIVAATLAGELLRDMTPNQGGWMIASAGFVAWLFAIAIRGPIRRLLLVLALSGLFAIGCQYLYDSANLVVFAVGPLLALNSSTLIVFTYDFMLERRERQRTRRTLERYVSKDVVREVLDNPETYLNTLGGVRKPVTILFSDVRGFTSMTESAEDEAQVVAQLNEYLSEMVAIVFAEHGSLDKFIGDAVMALWGSMTTEGVERDAQRAVAAALAMRKALVRLNINWSQRGMKELAFGIGINHGNPIVGNLGAEQRMEVSVIGDAVNVASRLEGLTKEYQQDLLLGESMVPLVQRRFVLRTVGSVQVKGKTRPVRVCTVAADQQAGEQPPPWLGRYEEGIRLYHNRKFAEGAEAFLECRRAQPNDYLSQLYLDECHKLLAHPPGPEWDTVVVMKSK